MSSRVRVRRHGDHDQETTPRKGMAARCRVECHGDGAAPTDSTSTDCGT
jgi:hypothetical protein